MSSTLNTYVYTDSEPLDAIIEIVRRSVAAVAMIRQDNVKVIGSVVDGMYQFCFDDRGDDRVLTLHTRCSCDLPNREQLGDLFDEEVVKESDNEGLVITIGSWGRCREISNEVANALSFLGKAFMLDEKREEDEGYFRNTDDLSIEDLIKRYGYSVYDALGFLGAVRRGGGPVPEGLEEELSEGASYLTPDEMTEPYGAAWFLVPEYDHTP